MKNLICWCCGARFTGLQDINHDDGYWLCVDCKREQEQDNENQYEKIFKMIYNWMITASDQEFIDCIDNWFYS